MHNIPFDYIIKNSNKSKNITITINNIGKVIIKKPKFLPKFIAIKHLNDNINWVIKHLKSRENKNPFENFYYKGKIYKINFKKGKLKIIIKHPYINIISINQTIGLNYLNKFLKNKAKSEIIKTVKKYGELMNIKYNNIKFKDQKTRWGSCSSKGNLNFNWRIIMASQKVLEYVVIHELAHRVEMNHSYKFWKIVEKYDPDFREHKRWLKINGQHFHNVL